MVDVLQATAVSIGDYVLTGGELPAMVVIDAVARLVPGVLGAEISAEEESYAAGVLEYPHYTRPADFGGWLVPEVLSSGNHDEIRRWRRRKAIEKTLRNRPELLKAELLTEEDQKIVAGLQRTGKLIQ